MDLKYRLRLTGMIGCTAFLLLSTPRINAAPLASQPINFAQDRDDWDRPSDAWNDVQRRGFHDGIEAARSDYAYHRRPDADDREEYRHPHVPGPMREAYRESFMRGYNVAMSHLTSPGPAMMPGPVVRDGGGWDAPPNEFDEVRRNGFRHGVEAARDDYEHHRRPDVDRHDTFRHPDVPREVKGAFQQGFRRGYRVAMDHLMGGYDRH